MSPEGTLIDDSFASRTLEDWQQRVADRLENGDLGSLESLTVDGVVTRPLYAARPVGAETRPLPGVSAPISACALLEVADPQLAAASLGRALEAGAEGLYLRHDRSTRLGLDLEDSGSLDSLGRDGMVLLDADEIGLFLGEQEWGGRPVWLEAGGNALPVTALWLAEFERRRVEAGEVALHCGADPFAALALDGTVPRDLMKLESEMAVLARFSSRHLPLGRAITVSTVPYQEAGAEMVAELGYAVASTLDYLRALEDSGLTPPDAAGEICWRFALGTNVFSEMAKLRAARVLWRMLCVACGVDEPPRAMIHAVSSRRSLSRRAPMNNSLRASGQMFAAACGGADAISLRTVTGVATGEAELGRLAVAIQAVLREEAHLGRVADPGAGSYYVESLTDELVRAGWAVAQQVERDGGMRDGLLSGAIASAVGISAGRRAAAFEAGEAAITGVTRYVNEEEAINEPSPLDAGKLASSLLERRAVRKAENAEPTDREIRYSRDFVVEQLVASARRGASLSDLAAQLGNSDGAESCEPFPLHRDAAPFEAGPGSES
jgi:methylmalonyl-CoA mutase